MTHFCIFCVPSTCRGISRLGRTPELYSAVRPSTIDSDTIYHEFFMDCVQLVEYLL